jgi:predicted metal-dependent phosphotriesterase family hydrolase
MDNRNAGSMTDNEKYQISFDACRTQTDSDESYIQTVTGKIRPDQLGYCQCHEHLFIADGQSARMVPSLRLDDLDATCSELELYKKHGGSGIVDAQPVGCGRMADLLLKASIRTGVNIIASTGFHKLVFYRDDHWFRAMDEDSLAALFIDDLENGMFVECDASKPAHRIESRAGVIKTASDSEGPSGEYRRLFLAAAEAAVQTGASILSHTEMGKGALEQIRLFTDHKVPVGSIIICHLDRDLTDAGYLLEVASIGVYLELDTIGRQKYHSDDDEARFIAAFLENGFEDRILLGLDTTRDRMKSYGGSIGLDYLHETFFPLLRSYGINDSHIHKFTVSNPAKAFRRRKAISPS